VRNGRLQSADKVSLLPFKHSLLREILSLLIWVGNCSRSGCSTAVSCSGSGSQSLRIAKFPVKFPVIREFALETGSISTASPANQSGARRFYPLRRIFEIFRFSGDSDRRPGSIGTAGPSLQWNVAKFFAMAADKLGMLSCRADAREHSALTAKGCNNPVRHEEEG